jgi:hypothetical protein
MAGDFGPVVCVGVSALVAGTALMLAFSPSSRGREVEAVRCHCDHGWCPGWRAVPARVPKPVTDFRALPRFYGQQEGAG